MPWYFFDIKNGHRVADVTGIELENNAAAARQGAAIAAQIRQDVPNGDMRRRVAVVNDDGKEVASIKIRE